MSHALVPGLFWMALMLLIHIAGWDVALSNRFYDPVLHRWVLSDSTWAYLILYRGGRAVVITAAAMSLTLILASVFFVKIQVWRRSASYLLICIALITGLASVGKHTSNMDCPKDLDLYGGSRPQIGLFANRLDGLPRAQCFPGGHSSGGFSFLALYFLLGERRRELRWLGLAAGLGLGLSFGFVQWGRGMHFISHDLCSALIAWTVTLGVYTGLYRSRVWSNRNAPAAD